MRRSDDWGKAAGATAELHFHDLRHTANTLASTAGAGTRELMTRMGHSSSRAALDPPAHDQRPGPAIADRLGAVIRGGGKAATPRALRKGSGGLVVAWMWHGA
ncbi:tyrosine-type recombinase/integrase [Streptomyces griseorubiginosus]|uniref:tyrosine-type recombinase/integrase n=1 Tax=Streptomyces griseorubiginosus TaxID=67304 RepID=UPI002E813BD9|nr:tyrosine-type recombinase/integrase [Streptomyces griseorubiginosus]WUB46348.1 site-specific integrase [Streptomyces griseorubiginosus]WUB54869.1 site-specific integrase [Streptomyces griseorubiginosus]